MAQCTHALKQIRYGVRVVFDADILKQTGPECMSSSECKRLKSISVCPAYSEGIKWLARSRWPRLQLWNTTGPCLVASGLHLSQTLSCHVFCTVLLLSCFVVWGIPLLWPSTRPQSRTRRWGSSLSDHFARFQSILRLFETILNYHGCRKKFNSVDHGYRLSPFFKYFLLSLLCYSYPFNRQDWWPKQYFLKNSGNSKYVSRLVLPVFLQISLYIDLAGCG